MGMCVKEDGRAVVAPSACCLFRLRPGSPLPVPIDGGEWGERGRGREGAADGVGEHARLARLSSIRNAAPADPPRRGGRWCGHGEGATEGLLEGGELVEEALVAALLGDDSLWGLSGAVRKTRRTSRDEGNRPTDLEAVCTTCACDVPVFPLPASLSPAYTPLI